MILPSNKEYIQTKRIILGTQRMKPEFVPLAEWINKTFDVKTTNIIYDILSNETPRIQICFEYEKEKNKFLTHDISYFDKLKQKAIAHKFSKIIKQQGLSKNNSYISKIFRLNKNGIYFTDNIFVIYRTFKPIENLSDI